MKVTIRLFAFAQLPVGEIALELNEGADVSALLKAVGEKWGRQLGSWNEITHEFAQNVLAASQGRMLQYDEKLIDGQQIQIIGQIIGG